jgi:hypothetical protein
VREGRTEADDIVQAAYNRALLDLILPPMQRVARGVGYALTIHGSLCRDIDLVAIPWVEHGVADREELLTVLAGAIGGITGRCHRKKEWSEKPHGRSATTILAWCGETTANIDLSVISTVPRDYP